MRANLLTSVAMTVFLSASSMLNGNIVPVQYYQNGYYVPPGYALVPITPQNQQYQRTPGGPNQQQYPAAPGYPQQGQPSPAPNYPPPGVGGGYAGKYYGPNNGGFAQRNPSQQPAPPLQQQPRAPEFQTPPAPPPVRSTPNVYSPPDKYVPPQTEAPSKAKSVGLIRVVRDGNHTSMGTGYVFKSSAGETLVGTAYHVIGRYWKDATFINGSRAIHGVVIYTNPERDQAVIRLDSNEGLAPAKVGVAHVGEVVSCYGWQGGRNWAGGKFEVIKSDTTTLLRPEKDLSDTEFSMYSMYALHSVNGVPMQAGMSGGPCFNKLFEVVGFNSAADMSTGGIDAYMGTPAF